MHSKSLWHSYTGSYSELNNHSLPFLYTVIQFWMPKNCYSYHQNTSTFFECSWLMEDFQDTVKNMVNPTVFSAFVWPESTPLSPASLSFLKTKHYTKVFYQHWNTDAAFPLKENWFRNWVNSLGRKSLCLDQFLNHSTHYQILRIGFCPSSNEPCWNLRCLWLL